MKKGIAIVATSLLLFVGCTEDKKEAKEQVTPKQEVTQNVEEKAKEINTLDDAGLLDYFNKIEPQPNNDY